MLKNHCKWGAPLLGLGLMIVPASTPAEAGPIDMKRVLAQGAAWGGGTAVMVGTFGGSETGPPGWVVTGGSAAIMFATGAGAEALNEWMTNDPAPGGSVTVPTPNGKVQVQCGPNGQPGPVSFGPNGNVTNVQGCTVGPQSDNSGITDPNDPTGASDVQLASADTTGSGLDGATPSCGSCGAAASCGSCGGSIQMAANCGAVGCGAGCGSCAAFG